MSDSPSPTPETQTNTAPSTAVTRWRSLQAFAARWWPLLLPLLAAALVYLPATQYQLVWDDTIFLRDVPLYRQPGGWWQALWQPFVLSPNYFRPLALLTFMIELNQGGINPALFHTTNLVLHAVNSLLVALLAGALIGRQEKDRRWLMASAGFLYALHPALIEGVAFISSRFDLLLTLCLLLALLAERYLTSWKRLAGVSLAFLLAALSKEMAVAFAAVLPLWRLAAGTLAQRQADQAPSTPPAEPGRKERTAGKGKEAEKTGAGRPSLGSSALRRFAAGLRCRWAASDIYLYASLLVAGLLYLLIRSLSLGYLMVYTGNSLPAGDIFQRFLLIVKSLAAYLQLILWPFTNLTPIHFSRLPVTPADVSAWFSLALLGLLALGLNWLLRHPESQLRTAGWLALAGLGALLPVLNLYPLELGGGAFIAERFLLFPLTLFTLAALTGLRGRLPLPAAALWLLACLAVIQLTLPHWHDDLSLWTWAQARAPYSSMPPTNLSLEYTNRGQPEIGLNLAQAALQLDPQNADAWNNLGLALFQLKNYAEAEKAFYQAATLLPQHALYWNNLAGALREQDRLPEAEQVLLEQALKLDPNLPAGHLNLGIVYLKAGRPDLAQAAFTRAAALLPPGSEGEVQALLRQTQDPAAWLQLGWLLMQNSEFQGALQAFDTAGQLGAAKIEVAIGLSAALIELNELDTAEQLINSALQEAPQEARLYNNLGLLLQKRGDLAGARELFLKAIELAPDWEAPQQNLQALEGGVPAQATPTPQP